jgi:hypothetical protein
MTPEPLPESFASIKEAFNFTSLSVEEVWVRCYALGGGLQQAEMSGYLLDDEKIDRHQRSIIAQALNEVFIDQGGDHPVPYPSPL